MIATWILIALAIILLACLWSTWTHAYFDKLKIPYDKPLPVFGNFGPFVFRKKSFVDTFNAIYERNKGSGVVGYFRMRSPWILINDPELIKLVTVKDFEYFTDHHALVSEEDDPLFGKFLFSLKGDRWKYMRHTLSPAFTTSKMKNMLNLVTDCGEQLADYLEKKCQENDGLFTADLKDLFTRFGNDVIATSAFGVHCDSLRHPENEFYQMGKRGVNMSVLKIMCFSFAAKLMRALKITLIPKDVNEFFQRLVKNTITQREKDKIIRPDMIHLLMEARRGTLKTENLDELVDEVKQHDKKLPKLTDEDITAQAFIFFLAGFDTTSTLLCFAFHLLACDPDILKRTQDEIDSMIENEGGKITYAGLLRLNYTEMVINETLRLWPPAFMTDRVCVKPYTIPATATNPSVQMNVGDAITIPVMAIHRDPDHFEDPLKFDPERFSDENKHKIKPFTYLPFGAGPRVCLGMRFAVMETKIALACVLSRFNLKIVPKSPVPLVLNKKSVPLAPEGGFWLGFTPRTKASS